MLAHIATSPGQTFLISVLNKPVAGELRLSTEAFNTCYAVASFLAAWPLMLVGAIQDRYGIRRTMLAIVVGLGATLVLASWVQGLVTLFLAFFFMRALGQGSLTMLANNTLAMWFRGKLGLVSGLQAVSMAGAMGTLPVLGQMLIEWVGWRWALVVQGLIVWGVMLPLLVVVFRNRPEDVGQRLDGAGKAEPDRPGESEEKADELAEEAASADPGDDAGDLTLGQAMQTPAYWILLLGIGLWGMISTAIVLNLVPILAAADGAGLSEQAAVATLTTFAVCTAASQFVGGVAADRYPLNVLLVGCFALLAGAVGLLLRAEGWLGAHGYAATYGLGQGVFSVVMNTAWARYYGRTHLGKIRGTVWTAAVAFSAAGPLLAAGSLRFFDSFTPLLVGFLGVYLGMMLLAPLARPPRRSER